MRLFFRFFALFAFIFTQSVVARDTEEFIYSSEYDYVKIAPQDTRALPNDHPVNIDSDTLKAALSAITHEKEGLLGIGKDKVQSIFSDDHLEKITAQLEVAFARASADQDIVFAMSGLHDAYLGEDRLSTSGRAFIRNNRLNIIFGKINVDYQIIPSDQAGLRSKRNRIEEEILLDEGIRTKQGRPDWLVVELGQFSRAFANERKPAARQQRARPLAASDAAPQRRTTSQSAQPGTSLEERLAKLKQLKDKGLIGEELYQQRMNEIANEL